jgi:hypothetical protein
MKLLDYKPTDESLVKMNRKVLAEELREMKLESSQRSFICYGLFALFAINTLFTLTLVLLLGVGSIVLSDTIIVTLIAETMAHGAAMFFTVIRSLFKRRE